MKWGRLTGGVPVMVVRRRRRRDEKTVFHKLIVQKGPFAHKRAPLFF